MEQEEFELPSPKRQRTESPRENRTVDKINLMDPAASEPHLSMEFADNAVSAMSTAAATKTSDNENDMLDVLMQHVEAESQPETQKQETNHDADHKASASIPADTTSEKSHDLPGEFHAETSEEIPDIKHLKEAENLTAIVQVDIASVGSEPNLVASQPTTSKQEEESDKHTMDLDSDHTSVQPEASKSEISETALHSYDEAQPDSAGRALAEAVVQIDGIPPTDEQDATAEQAGAEWEVDSSPYESSSSDSSDDSSSDDSDDDDDADGDYAMLDPEEQARILMHGDAGSDDEGNKSKVKGEGSGLKTANEQQEDVPPIPEISVTDDMQIEQLGTVEAVVENNVLIMAKTSGEYQVLEAGSLLCFEDRKVAGVVAETLGRVEQPLYTMRFKSRQDIQDRDLNKGVTLFYVHAHSSFVFTQPLKAVKGSDASNIHDEEVGADEMEFSDDEAEAEYKRQVKLKKQGRLGADTRGRGTGRGRGGQRGGKLGHAPASETNGAAYGNGSLEMNYDDVEEGEEGYTPLTRPSNLHEMNSSASTAPGTTNYMPPPPFAERGGGRGRGREGRNQGRGGRGGSHRGRGGFSQQQQRQNHTLPNAFPSSSSGPGFQLPFPPPPPPMLTPQNLPYPQSFIASPISPLPQQQFNFSSGFSNSPSYGNNYQQQQQYAQQSQQQPQQQQQTPYFNPAVMQQFLQSQQHQQQQQPPSQQMNNYGGNWQPNQAAVAEVQRQLEEMRQAAARGGQ